MLHSTVTILLSFLMASCIYVQPLPVRKMLVYAFALSISDCLLSFPGSWLFLVLEKVVFFFWQFHFCAKSWMMTQGIRILWCMASSVFYQGGSHSLLWFVPLHASACWLWLVYGGMFLLLHVKWKDMLAHVNYLYRLHAGFTNTTLHLKGRLNSGNLLSYKGIPILFISPSYKTYFRKQDIELVVMNIAGDTSAIRYHVCLTTIEGYHKHRALVCYRNRISLPLNCEVLLNMSMMTLG